MHMKTTNDLYLLPCMSIWHPNQRPGSGAAHATAGIAHLYVRFIKPTCSEVLLRPLHLAMRMLAEIWARKPLLTTD
eukprot:1759208-Amphidinium_carterae.1